MILFPSGRKKGAKFGCAVVRYLALVFSVRIHHPKLQIARTDQPLGQQRLIILDLPRCFWVLSAIDDLFAVIREERAAIIAELMRELADMTAISVHRENVKIAVAH